MKRLFSIVLSVVMLVGIMVFPASAYERPTVKLCSSGSCQNAVSILCGYGCKDPAAALNLYANTDSYYSLSDILRKYGCSEKRCERIIGALQRCGYNVDIVNEGGITVSPDPITIETLPVETVGEVTTEPQTEPQPASSIGQTEAPMKPTEGVSLETEAVTQAEKDHYTPNKFEEEVIRLVNETRALYLVPALELNTELCEVAHLKARDMSEKRYFDHTSPTYGSPFDMMKRFGITYRTAGENIAMGYRTPQQVVDGWMNSTGHRANILNSNFKEIGVGYVEEGHYWSQMFIG